MKQYNNLKEFKTWWLETRSMNPLPEYPIINYGNITGVTLYREGQYQVEMFLIKPNNEIPPHTHPNVESYEVYISGDVSFMASNRWFNQKVTAKVKTVEVNTDTIHAAKIGPNGGCFISIQHWLNEKPPTSVGYDWDDSIGNTRCPEIKCEKNNENGDY